MSVFLGHQHLDKKISSEIELVPRYTLLTLFEYYFYSFAIHILIRGATEYVPYLMKRN